LVRLGSGRTAGIPPAYDGQAAQSGGENLAVDKKSRGEKPRLIAGWEVQAAFDGGIFVKLIEPATA
jgi:hypothetical protein